MEYPSDTEAESGQQEKPEMYDLKIPIDTRHIRFHLDPLGLDDLKDIKIVRFGLRLAIGLLVLMGLAEICFLAALLIRSLL